MITIISIIKNKTPLHPAVGNFYDVSLSNGLKLEVSDDEFMGKYCFDESRPLFDQMDFNKVNELMNDEWKKLEGKEWIEE
jgi:hypothetical protein